jgi:hypothetical protein
LIKAKVFVLEGECGHQAPGCEAKTLNPAIVEFLKQ